MIGCYVDTMYSLFIFLLVKENKDTVYFLEENIIKKINKEYLKDEVVLLKGKSKRPFKKLKRLYNNFKLYREFQKNKIEKFYLQDHLYYSSFFMYNCKKETILLEDGTRNYNEKILKIEVNFNEYKGKSKLKIFLKKLSPLEFLSIKKRYPSYGLSDKISKMLLTEILPIPKQIKDKTEIVDLKEKWENLTKERQEQILNIFNIDKNELEMLSQDSKKILLLTQPLSEDSFVSEDEKIKMYKDILMERGIKKIYIKGHPREVTDYSKAFGNDIEVINISKDFPVELLPLLGLEFKKTITIFSTAAYFFKKYGEVEFIGTKPYKKLYEAFGNIEL